MKLVKLHKFICNKDRTQSLNTDVYVNVDKITWIEEVVDDGKKHSCVYFNDDYIDVFEKLEDVVKNLTADNVSENTSSKEKTTRFKRKRTNHCTENSQVIA